MTNTLLAVDGKRNAGAQRERHRTFLARMCLAVCGVMFGIAAPADGQEPVTWRDTAFEDFIQGRLDASGQNLFVSRDGNVRTIHRFDLNQDGHIDLVFNNTHDDAGYRKPTWVTVDRTGAPRIGTLPVRGSRSVVTADLDGDGAAELLFAPARNNVQNSPATRQNLTVMWGGADGWSRRRVTDTLPVHRAVQAVVADLDGDGRPDVVALAASECWNESGRRDGMVLRVFWGGPDGYRMTGRQDVALPAVTAIAAADFDGDGADDVVLLGRDGRPMVLWGEPREITGRLAATPSPIGPPLPGATCLHVADLSGAGPDIIVGSNTGTTHVISPRDGRTWSEPHGLQTGNASHIAVGDLDGDGHADLVLTYLRIGYAAGGEAGAVRREASTRILWGGADGFDPERETVLPVPHVSATAIGDVDGDGLPDLALAVYQGETTYDARSPVFLNRGARRFEKAFDVPTQGATDVVILPACAERPAHVVFANTLDGTLEEAVPLTIYWGGEDGFDPERRTLVPFMSGYECGAFDLNANGWTDLVAINSGHGGQEVNPTLGANIFWGSAQGIDFDAPPTILREKNLSTVHAADLNYDGFLDLVLGAYQRPNPEDDILVIYYGSEEGFSRQRRQEIATPGGSSGVMIGDFDRDGRLDIAVVSYSTDCLRVLYNSDEGFSADRQRTFYVPAAGDLQAADLNDDGWLDLIATIDGDPISNHRDIGSLIFWGGPDGFDPRATQRLPALTPLGMVVADLDGDGYLDVFSPSYHGEGSRDALPSPIFWGSAEGFSPENRTLLLVDSGSDALAADFNGNGLLDLAVACHFRDGNHRTMSLVYLNDGERFRRPEVIELPTLGTHWMYRKDIGHIGHRRNEQVYESAVFSWVGRATAARFTVEADQPTGTRLEIQARAASDADALNTRPWRTLDDRRLTLDPDAGWLQYRALFFSDNGDRYPVLQSVEIRLDGPVSATERHHPAADQPHTTRPPGRPGRDPSD